MKKTYITSFVLILLSVPFIVSAQTPAPFTGNDITPASAYINNQPTNTASLNSGATCNLSSYSDIITCAIYIINSLIPVIMALIVVWIIWSAFNFAKAEGEERGKYRDAIVWGIVALFIVISIYGLVAILSNTFGTNNTTQLKAPGVTSDYIQPANQ